MTVRMKSSISHRVASRASPRGEAFGRLTLKGVRTLDSFKRQVGIHLTSVIVALCGCLRCFEMTPAFIVVCWKTVCEWWEVCDMLEDSMGHSGRGVACWKTVWERMDVCGMLGDSMGHEGGVWHAVRQYGNGGRCVACWKTVWE